MNATTTQPLDRLLELLPTAKNPSGSGWYNTKCPAHNDKKSSFGFKETNDGGVIIKCFAGCTREAILDALGIQESDLRTHGNYHKQGQSTAIIDVYDLAYDKIIYPTFLMSIGVEEGQETYHKKDGTTYTKKGVVISYHTEDGKPYARRRLRTALQAKKGSLWSESDAPIIPYGLDRLEMARKVGYIIIVEGESDCWTLWAHDIPALGVPGANMAQCLQASYLNGIEKVFVIQEPDKAGTQFPKGVKEQLETDGYTGKIYTLDLKSETGEKDPNDLHKSLQNAKAFKEKIELARTHARPLFEPGQSKKTASGPYSAEWLMEQVLPEAKFAIPGILPEGLSLLCGKPKLGKSWLAMASVIAIALGGYVLGKIKVEQGEALYLALEDNNRRLQKRLGTLLNAVRSPVPSGLYFETHWPRMDNGGLEQLEQWIEAHPHCRLIVIDTWAKIAPRPQGRQRGVYAEDYDALTPLKELADRYGIAILCIHHLRKLPSEANDVVDEISGSTGLTGAVDGFLVLKRERGQFDGTLHVIGRDIEEEKALALTFDHTTAQWIFQGNAEDFAKTKEQQAILDAITAVSPNGLTAKEIAATLGKNVNTIRSLLYKMVQANAIRLEKYTYYRSERSEDSEDSERSEVSLFEDVDGSKLHYADTKPHYGSSEALPVTERPVEPVQLNGNSKPHYAHYDSSENGHRETVPSSNSKPKMPEEYKTTYKRFYDTMKQKDAQKRTEARQKGENPDNVTFFLANHPTMQNGDVAPTTYVQVVRDALVSGDIALVEWAKDQISVQCDGVHVHR